MTRTQNTLLKEVSNRKTSHTMILGAFNFKKKQWDSQTTTAGPNNVLTKCLKSWDCYLYQHITESTRYREGQTPSTLDLVFTNEQNMIDIVTYNNRLGKSGHLMLSFDFVIYRGTKLENKESKMPKRYFYKGDYKSLGIGRHQY